jgi:hypothetical protein
MPRRAVVHYSCSSEALLGFNTPRKSHPQFASCSCSQKSVVTLWQNGACDVLEACAPRLPGTRIKSPMFNSLTTTCVSFLTVLCAFAAQAQHTHSAPQPSVKAEIVSSATHSVGQTVATVLRLTGRDGKPLTPEGLQVAHTEKLHLLVVDDALSDYHHEHPVPTDKPGEYRFDFTPRAGGTYHIWADVLPIATGQQEYAKTQLKVQGAAAKKEKTLNDISEAQSYLFALSTENDEPLEAGKATVVTVKVSGPDAKDFTALEPVMGAFAHMVGFPEDLASVTHVHPTGKEPETANARGGPELQFHVEPEKAGFHKFYLQTQIGGREVYAPFGLEVKPASETKPAAAAGEYVCPMHPEVKQKSPGKCPKCGMALVPAKEDPGHDHRHRN